MLTKHFAYMCLILPFAFLPLTAQAQQNATPN
jgi:hypothetical protein